MDASDNKAKRMAARPNGHAALSFYAPFCLSTGAFSAELPAVNGNVVVEYEIEVVFAAEILNGNSYLLHGAARGNLCIAYSCA